MASRAERSDALQPDRAALTARLELSELLLAGEDLRECARQAMHWLESSAGADAALLALREEGGLRGCAGIGLPADEIESFAWVPEADGGLLIDGGDPRVLPAGRVVDLPAGLRLRRLLMTRITGHDGTEGVLLAGPVTPLVTREVIWLASTFGKRLASLRASHALGESGRRLARETSLLHAVVNASPDPVLLTDTEGRLIVANARAEGLFAAGEDDSDGRRRAIGLNNMLFSAAIAERAIQEGEPARRELLLADPNDGSDLLFELLSTAMYTPGEGTGIVSILRNVNDLQRATRELEEHYRLLRSAEESVRAERDRLNLIIDTVADPILVTDPSGNIIHTNMPAERLFTVSHAAGKEAERVVRANDAQFSAFLSNLLLAGGETRWRGDLTLTDPRSGASIPVEAVAGKVMGTSGELTAVVTILHDRTEALEKAQLYEQVKRASVELEELVRERTAELVRQNEILQRQRIELEQASNLKSQFLANMSHEFRTPLNGILGYTSMLLQGIYGKLSGEQQHSLGRVDANARHLLSIIEDILDISRIEAGKLPLHLSEFRLPEIVGQVLAQLEPLIKQRPTVEVSSRIDDKLTVIRSDEQKVKQILLNLVTNALKFTPKGEIRIEATYSAATDEVAVAVIDTGIGIAKEDQEKVFEDFRQVDSSSSRPYGGTGLGLSICRRLAAMIGGKITLKSALGKGATFTLFFPRRPRRKS